LKARRARPPLDEAALKEIALRYVTNYATTRSRLCAYLERKLRERGWNGEAGPQPDRIAQRFAELGLITDSGFALGRARALISRGYGANRLREQLRRAGVTEEDSGEAFADASANAVAAALRFAQRRRIGPFADGPHDSRAREKALAAMVRAGHDFPLARSIVMMNPGAEHELLNLGESYPPDGA
jgi:regulatory protein